ncbi:MAG TPA: hypothetical protein VMG59_06745 [Phycisphaerae bacterium]|nr:hypothetical protein [Phycisphaerae bacterium]
MSSEYWLLMMLSGVLAGLAIFAVLIRRDFLGTAGGMLLFIAGGLLNIAIADSIQPVNVGDSGIALAITTTMLASWQLAVLMLVFRCLSRKPRDSSPERISSL